MRSMPVGQATWCTLGRLNAARYSSWKQGRRQAYRYQGFSASAVAGSSTISSTRCRCCLHHLEVDVPVAAPGVEHRGVVVGPPVVDEVLLDGLAQHHGLEVVPPGLLPARAQVVGEVGVGGPVAPHPDRRRRPLEHVHRLGVAPQRGDALDAGGPGADDGHRLVVELGHRFGGPAARVPVVPPGGVERPAGEGVHALDDGELEQVQDPGRQHVVPGAEPVPPVGLHHPAAVVLVPGRRLDTGVEQRLAGEVVLLGDGLEVGEDLAAGRVPVPRHVAELLQHRQVDVGLDVAHDPRVAVPVPGPADAAGLVDDADALDPDLTQAGRGDDAGDAATDDDDVGIVLDRFPLGHRGEGIGEVAGEALVVEDVDDVRAARDQAPFALEVVTGPDPIEVLVLAVAAHSASRCGVTAGSVGPA